MIEFDEFVEEIARMVREVVEQCEPDEDPEPVLFVGHDDTVEICQVGPMFENEATKRVFAARVFPEILKKYGADMYAMVNSTWAWVSDDPELTEKVCAWQQENPELTLDSNPFKPPAERVMIVFGEKGGRVVMRDGDLTRNPDVPPSLSEWRTLENNWLERAGPMGRMIDFAMAALTGVTLVTDESLREATRAVAQSEEIRSMITDALEALGQTPEEAMARFALMSEDEREADARILNEKLEEMFPEYADTLKSIANEHMADPASALLENSPVEIPEGAVVMVSLEDGFEVIAAVSEGSPEDLLND